MAEYGCLGGIPGGRDIDSGDAFEVAVEAALGARIKTDDELCRRLWGSLANVSWRNDNGDTASYTFRAAGDMIAAIRGSGDYMDWYCSGPIGYVDEEVESALATRGWKPDEIEEPL